MANQTEAEADRPSRLSLRFPTQPLVSRALRASLVLILSLMFFSAAAAAETETDVSQYRATLLQVIDTAGEILYTINPDSAEAVADVVEQLEQFSDEELETIFIQNLSLHDLQEDLQTLDPHLSAIRRLSETDNIEIPPIDVTPSECEQSTPVVAMAAQLVASIFEEYLAIQKYVCLQTDEGFNAALSCGPYEVIRAIASSTAEGEDFCLAQQNLARNKAMLDLTRGAGMHLNEFVDEVPLTSRASQAALDTVQSDFDDVQASTQDIQATLDSGYSQLDSQATALTEAVANLGDDLNGLASLLHDINFRSTVNLAFLDDASLRVADLKQRAQDIEGDAESITTVLGNVNSANAQLSAALEAAWFMQRRDRIAADLGNTQADNPAHALPSSSGGELELAREIVINAIFGLQALGSVDTSQALALVGQADVSYNAGQYPEAYRALKQAYQSLDALSEAR